MVFPSIRSFQEITLINYPKNHSSLQDNFNPSRKVSDPLYKSFKFSSKKYLRNLRAKKYKTYQHPIAS